MSQTSYLSRINILIKAIISFFLIGIILYQVDSASLITKLKTINFAWFFLANILYFGSVFLRAYRWKELLLGLGIRVNFYQLSKLYFIGFFFNQFIPTGVGGDLVRTYILSKDGVEATQATSSVIMDRATGIYSLLVIGAITSFLSPGVVSKEIRLFLIIITILITVVFIILFLFNIKKIIPQTSVKFLKIFVEFYETFPKYSKKLILKALCISIFFNFLLIIINLFLAISFNVSISLIHLFIFIPLISLTLILPISINGLGTRELAYVVLFGQIGVAKESALSISVAFYGLNLIMALIGGILFILRSPSFSHTDGNPTLCYKDTDLKEEVLK
ncbi:MAG: flippase-like domain-containing protein [Acidobacteria bacterium]|nr:flippase-like domain-containing protein [Acidobacteriota bacterium]MBN8726044.1 flippase-like domain-containing protein [Acidobacteriota bacterium]